ncbi:hypothetical protein B0H17DRAFT_92476 [Mycena rosella]|uniref:Uncharacterized protein n=1 Tax=Mycena rosella TaxID=1033263 RepID=A0AAD7GNQ7_MYCRO|nr:hypothetical protein B0H17DRAFT_92476 [Mycena rosella]
MSFQPKLSFEEADKIMCASGMPHEIETCLVDGRVQRVYKNLWPSLRDFWLACASKNSNKTYIVFEDERLTYGQGAISRNRNLYHAYLPSAVHDKATEAAAIFHNIYGIKKGDRVGICSRNCPEYLIVFWACHLLGAVTVLANAWLPPQPLQHCLINTQCKLLLLDPERADQLEPDLVNLRKSTGATGVLVFDDHEGKTGWNGMDSWNFIMTHWNLDRAPRGKQEILEDRTDITPEDNATIIFTSGTTGLPKGVLSTNRQFLSNVINVTVGAIRASLRRGDGIPSPPVGPHFCAERGILVATALFHVTGLTSFSMMATMNGFKIILMRKWDPEHAARLIKTENIAVAGGVPAMVADLVRSSLVGFPLEGILFGGSPSPDSLAKRARQAFPNATMSQAYGLTETNSVAVAIAGEDYLTRPSSTGRPCPVNDIMIMHEDKMVGPGSVGEVWLRGPNIMKEYWSDPDATAKVLTSDGWLKTGDLGLLDAEGFLYIKDRLKDVIIRGGENIDSVSVENALYSDSRVMEAAAVAVPDERLGELVAAVVFVNPEFRGQVTEGSLIALARTKLPRFAVPVMIKFEDKPFELTPSGKIMKGGLRKIVRRSWEERKATLQATKL